MNYAALLFCPEDKTSRVVTQLLSDLEFAVEACGEPFLAVKKLMSQRYDAMVVDCSDEQNAALLFKSVRNSQSNQAALIVALVADQAGVAKAFRLGANLVLTKPINVEQAKGTMRVARGLLKKGEASKSAVPLQAAVATVSQKSSDINPAATHSAKSVAPPPPPQSLRSAVPTFTTVSNVISPVASSALELEPETTPETGADDAALLESMPTPVMPVAASTPVAESQPAWPKATHSGAAAAVAPAKEKPPATALPLQIKTVAPVIEKNSHIEAEQDSKKSVASTPEPPLFTAASGSAGELETGSKRTLFIVLAVAAVVLVAGYLGWTKMHSGQSAASAVASTAQPAVQQLETPKVAASHAPSEVQAAPNVVKTAVTSATSPETKTQASAKPTTESTKNAAAESAKAPLMVKSEEPKAETVSAPSDDNAAPVPPPVEIASGNALNAMSGIVGPVNSTVPKQSTQSYKLSQGVSQGLLVKKVPPVYPRAAVQAHIQGAVDLMATISKDGNVTNIQAVSGDPLLKRAAADAVKQWKYKPYYLDGQAIEIQTQITVNFKLP